MSGDSTVDPVSHFANRAPKFHALYEECPAFRERYAIWSDILQRRAPRAGAALDMGCGTGVFSFLLAERGWQVIGVDGAAEMVAFCEDQRRTRGANGVRFLEGRLPAVDEAALGQADLVISSSVVEFVEDMEGTLDLFARLLRPCGVLVLSMPNAASLSRLYERVEYRLTGKPDIYRFIRHFSGPRRLAERLAVRGFALEEAQYYAHGTRLAQLGRALFLPRRLTEDLFVAVFRKAPGPDGAAAP